MEISNAATGPSAKPTETPAPTETPTPVAPPTETPPAPVLDPDDVEDLKSGSGVPGGLPNQGLHEEHR